ncbi:hypothetical protein BDZ94DRAFT_1316257 [Collybia nuda]|uniref:Uncharacterized protein n=1 Tax=Collybia nuda TaxID=64659 RepID=A0A9P5XPR3_9AGAR|nr:hypothetical protein BDZ94DRAFT_1316257 [Collybia nuda]
MKNPPRRAISLSSDSPHSSLKSDKLPSDGFPPIKIGNDLPILSSQPVERPRRSHYPLKGHYRTLSGQENVGPKCHCSKKQGLGEKNVLNMPDSQMAAHIGKHSHHDQSGSPLQALAHTGKHSYHDRPGSPSIKHNPDVIDLTHERPLKRQRVSFFDNKDMDMLQRELGSTRGDIRVVKGEIRKMRAEINEVKEGLEDVASRISEYTEENQAMFQLFYES